MKYLLPTCIALALLLTACGDDDSGAPPSTRGGSTCGSNALVTSGECWTQVLPPGNGGFIPYPGSGDEPKWAPGKYPMTLNPVIAFNGDLWMTSSTTLAFSSPDGVTWTKHDKYETPGRLAITHAFFKDHLWMFGGSDYRTENFSNEIWSSADGTIWTKAGNGTWPGRDSTTVITFRGKLWLFGGASHRDDQLATDAFLNDVWSSDDGINWTQVTASAAWSPRSYPRIAILNDEMYLLGGESQADVWKSSNGKDWVQLTPDAGWGIGREGYGAQAFAGGLWVFGGYVGDSRNGVNDVWYSQDGSKWTLQTEHAPWTPRDPISIVYRDKLWLFAGKYTGSDDSWNGDLWTMTMSP